MRMMLRPFIRLGIEHCIAAADVINGILDTESDHRLSDAI